MSEPSKDELDRVTRKIKHCLALSKSSNENEAATALRQAKRLMDKYRLTEIDVQLSSVGHAYGKAERVSLKRWERDLASVVAQTFNCHLLTQTAWNPHRHCAAERPLFVGVVPGPDIARYAFDSLHVKATLARREYVAHLKRAVSSRGARPETRGDHFAIAWVQGVWRKLQVLVPVGEDDPAAADERALVHLKQRDDQLIDAFLQVFTGGAEIGQARAPRKQRVNPADMIKGLTAGQMVEVGHGIGTDGQALQQIEAGSPA